MSAADRCLALSNLALGDAQCRASIIESRALEALIAVIKTQQHGDAAAALCLENAVSALMNLARDSHGQTAIGLLGGIEAVLTAMKARTADSNLQKLGGALLQMLSHEHEQNRIVIMSLISM